MGVRLRREPGSRVCAVCDFNLLCNQPCPVVAGVEMWIWPVVRVPDPVVLDIPDCLCEATVDVG